MKIRSMSRCALLAALMAVCGWLAVPLGDISITMQTFGVFLTLCLLGGRLGSVTCLVYLCLGGVGLPVFTGFQGGISMLLGPTGGYLWGFLAAALIFWALERRMPMWLCMCVGMVICYACGTVWYCFAYASGGLWAVILKCVVPYVIPDAIKLALALLLAKKLKGMVR